MNTSLTKQIARDIVKKIALNELKIDQQIQTEGQISLTYNVSRIVARNAYKLLLDIGAIYVVPKKGYFVAKHFAGLVKPYSFGYKFDRVEKSEQVPSIFLTEFINNQNHETPSTVLVKKYYLDNNLIIFSETVIPHYLKKNMQESFDFTDYLIDNNLLISSVIISKFEKDNTFGEIHQLAEYKINYCVDGTVILTRYIIYPPTYNSVRQEKIL